MPSRGAGAVHQHRDHARRRRVGLAAGAPGEQRLHARGGDRRRHAPEHRHREARASKRLPRPSPAAAPERPAIHRRRPGGQPQNEGGRRHEAAVRPDHRQGEGDGDRPEHRHEGGEAEQQEHGDRGEGEEVVALAPRRSSHSEASEVLTGLTPELAGVRLGGQPAGEVVEQRRDRGVDQDLPR